MDPTLTTRGDLRALMANEFHTNGSSAFLDSEPQNYIKRLTDEQIKLLNEEQQAPTGHLTAFITFGDGFFDRLMGADFDLQKGQDSVRPNSSFALFHKQPGKIELVFYTRFFVVSYSGDQTVAKDARKYCRQNDKTKAFDAMSKIYTIRDYFTPLSSPWKKKPIRYGLRITRIRYPAPTPHPPEYFPWILLTQKTGAEWRTPTWFKGNTIHGIYNTKGCWMLLRNFQWDWPHENAGSKFSNLTKCYLNLRAAGPASPTSVSNFISCIKSSLSADHPAQSYTNAALLKWFLVQSRNFSYYNFLFGFIGLKFNDQRDWIAGPGQNCWKYTLASQMQNLFETTPFNDHQKNSLEKPWAYCFLFKRTVKFTDDPGLGTADKFK